MYILLFTHFLLDELRFVVAAKIPEAYQRKLEFKRQLMGI